MKKLDCYIFFIAYKKWVKLLIIKETDKQYQIEQEVLREQARNKIRELSEEEKK